MQSRADRERRACDTLGRQAAHRTSHRPSPLCTVLEKCTCQPQCCGVAWRWAADGLLCSSAAAQQLKYSNIT